MFIADELKIRPQATANALSSRTVSELQGQLAKRGVKLLVVLVPDKSRIAAQQLCAIERSTCWPAVRRIGGGCRRRGVEVLDLAPTLQPLGSGGLLRVPTRALERSGAERSAAAGWPSG